MPTILVERTVCHSTLLPLQRRSVLVASFKLGLDKTDFNLDSKCLGLLVDSGQRKGHVAILIVYFSVLDWPMVFVAAVTFCLSSG